MPADFIDIVENEGETILVIQSDNQLLELVDNCCMGLGSDNDSCSTRFLRNECSNRCI